MPADRPRRWRPSLGAVTATLGAAALVALLAYGLSITSADSSIDDGLAAGDRPVAPSLRLPLLSGQGEGALTDYRGDVVVLNAWASWCDPCRDESPLLQRWHERIAGRGATVLGVDALDVTSDALAFVREYGLTYPMLRDEDGSSLQPFGVVGYPETFVIDRDGRIAARRRGPVDEAFMRSEILPLLRRSDAEDSDQRPSAPTAGKG